MYTEKTYRKKLENFIETVNQVSNQLAESIIIVKDFEKIMAKDTSTHKKHLKLSKEMIKKITGIQDLFFGKDDKRQGIIRSPKENVLSRIGLDIDNKKLVKFFSQGMLQRLKLAGAYLISPKILLLDEPRTSLDQEGLVQLENLLDEWKKNKTTIVIVSHNKNWLSDTATRIIEIN